MASEKQILANRRNAQSSTGPKTPEGKAAVRFNALTLGLSAKAVVIGENDPATLHQLCENLLAGFAAEDERYLLEEIAVSRLELARTRQLEATLIMNYKERPLLSIDGIERLSRIKARLQRHIEKCSATLRSIYQRRQQDAQKMQNQTQIVNESNTTPDPEPEPEPRSPISTTQIPSPITQNPPPITHPSKSTTRTLDSPALDLPPTRAVDQC